MTMSSSTDTLSDEVEEVAQPHPPTLEGYLLKQQRGTFLRLWQRRWFELNGAELVYRPAPGERSFKALDLRRLTLTGSTARKFAFGLTEGPGKRVIRLAASSDQERSAWWHAILAAQRLAPAPSPTPRPTTGSARAGEGGPLARYERVAYLSRGASGKVWKVQDRETGDFLALKVMEKASIVRQGLEGLVAEECNILQELHHPFIVKLHTAFQTPAKLCLVLDYHAGGTLQHLLEKWTRIPEQVARFYATEIALALNCLHSQNVIHRDLKPSNVLISSTGHAILTDFGVASRSVEAHTFCGTLHYVAPEVVAQGPYTKAVDWWGYGVMLYLLLTGALPFLTQDIVGCSAPSPAPFEGPEFPPDMAPAARTLLQGLLERDPTRRLGFAELPTQPFFARVDWEAAAKLRVPCPYLPDHCR